MFVKSWYEPITDFYVMEFDDPAFALPEWAVGQKQGWSMFTHGVCTARVGNTLLFHRIAIVGANISEPSDVDLAQRMEQTIRILQLMGEEAADHHLADMTSRQCLAASDVLAKEKVKIISALLASHADLQHKNRA